MVALGIGLGSPFVGLLSRGKVGDRTRLTDHKGKQSRHKIDLPEDEALIDRFKEPLKKGDRVVESTYKVGDVRHHTFRREGEPQKAVYDKRPLPRLLFVGAAL